MLCENVGKCLTAAADTGVAAPLAVGSGREAAAAAIEASGPAAGREAAGGWLARGAPSLMC